MSEITINLDESMKSELISLCNAMGLDLDSFFGIYIRRVLLDRRIPFEISAEREYPDEPQESSFLQGDEGEIIQKALEELKALGEDE